MTAQAERLARIETLVEGIAKSVDKNNEEARAANEKLQNEVKALREDLIADKAELAALKNRGIGLLIGVGALGGAAGTFLSKVWSAVVGS